MPYHNGARVTQEEYLRLKHEREGTETQYLRTGPNGANPAPGPVIDKETGAPASKAGTKRSKTSKKSTDAAIANALGTALADLPDLKEDVNDPE